MVTGGLEGQVKKELKNLEQLYTYFDGKSGAMQIKWEDTYDLMERYGLDVADAMNLNFALTFTDGIATTDGDFKDVDQEGFDVYMPQDLI